MTFFSNLENFLLRKRSVRFEAWQILFVAVLMLLGLIAYGAFVKDAAQNYNRAGILSKTAFKVASIPSDTAKVFSVLSSSYHPEYAWEQRFDDQSGFQFSESPSTDGALLLLSRFDGDAQRTSIEVVDLDSGEVIHQYSPNVREIAQHLRTQAETMDSPDPRIDLGDIFHPQTYGAYHPIVEADGSLLFQDFYSPIVKIDACSRLEWALHGSYHHAIEQDAEGNYWTVVLEHPASVPNTGSRFYDDAIVSVSPDGEILFQKPLSEIFLENGFEHLVYPHIPFHNDPFHVNDVQPALEDGPHWKKGDLFLSVRDLSMIIQYRPSTNKIIWSRAGPWMLQHDVDILNDRQIAVFNNNVATGRIAHGDHINSDVIVGTSREMYVRGTNESLIYDFATGDVSSPFKEGYEKNDIRTVIEGLHEILPNGDVFVEEAKYGRLLVMSKSGDVRWSFVNRAEDGMVYNLHWSRYIEGDMAAALREHIAAGMDCTN